MAYDTDLADRVRELVATEPGLDERHMFGGLAFLINGNMSVAASRSGGLLVRVPPDETEALTGDDRVRPMVMAGQPRRGWLHVDATADEDDWVEAWVMRGVSHARSLPAKEAVDMGGYVTAVSSSATHTFSKPNRDGIRLLTGLGVEGDAHLGVTVKHRSRVARDPSQPNLRQVHLIHAELHDELLAAGFTVAAGDMGENVTTRGVDLLALPTGTRLHLGGTAVVEVTGLRNPCVQIDLFQPGLMKAVLGRDEHGDIVRKSGVMSVVLADGTVHADDPIEVELPATPHRPLAPV